MAIMGVHINGGGQNSISTSLGEELAKSIWGDPELEMKLALQRQEYENTAWQRRKWDAEIAANQAATEKLAAEAADQAYQTRERQNAAGIIADQQAGLLEPPAPVEISPAHTELPATVDLDTPYGRYAGGGNIGEELPMKPGVPEVAIPQDPNTPFGIMQLGEGAGISLPAVGGFGSPERPDMPVPIEVPAEMGVPPDKQAAYERDVAAIRARVKAAMAMGQSATDIAKGMGISEGAVRMLSSDPEQQELGKSLYGDTRPAAAAGPNASPYLKGELDMRKQIEGLDAYKKLSAVVPVYLSMLKSSGGPLDQAALLDLVYGLATAEDPGSVVREQDSLQVKRIGGLSGELQGVLGYLTGDNPITPEIVAKIMRIAHNRVGSYKAAYDHQARDYIDIATRSGYDVRNAVPTFPDIVAPPPLVDPKAAAEDDAKYGGTGGQ
jgi:hypothetical protein